MNSKWVLIELGEKICCTESITTSPYYKAIDCDCEEE
jgi:hypothetical protein